MRAECAEVVGILYFVNDNRLEKKFIRFLIKLSGNINATNVEARHCIIKFAVKFTKHLLNIDWFFRTQPG